MSIEAMKQVRQIFKDYAEPNSVIDLGNLYWALGVALQAIAEAEKQEPVAWMREDEDCTDCIVWEQTEEHTIPLYTTPPQREWQSLTDEEKHECYLRIDIWSRCYEMIEAKLKEKNCG